MWETKGVGYKLLLWLAIRIGTFLLVDTLQVVTKTKTQENAKIAMNSKNGTRKMDTHLVLYGTTWMKSLWN